VSCRCCRVAAFVVALEPVTQLTHLGDRSRRVPAASGRAQFFS
jgi:hypothetical protein